jgi:hypothetical protein
MWNFCKWSKNIERLKIRNQYTLGDELKIILNQYSALESTERIIKYYISYIKEFETLNRESFFKVQ